jgi:hypothetical protein
MASASNENAMNVRRARSWNGLHNVEGGTDGVRNIDVDEKRSFLSLSSSDKGHWS